MKTLIIGATGTIGKAITRLCEKKGDTVIAASRNSTPAINIDDPDSVDQFFESAPPLDCIICAAGNASFGKLSELTADQVNLGINSKLLGQVNLVRKGMQKLKPGGVIILTGGMLAYQPWPETSNIAMVNAALEGFVKAAALELEDDKRVLIVHPPLVRETAAQMGMDAAPWPSAVSVAETYLSSRTKSSNGQPVFVEGYSPN